VLLVAAGGVEGACLGTGQALALNATGINLPQRRWIAATALGAMIAWAIGLLPSTLPAPAWDDPVVLSSAIALGTLLLLAMPALQAAVLAYAGRPAWSWLGISAIAWLTGLLWTLAPMPLVDESAPPLLVLAAFGAAGVLMALTVAAITGSWVVRVVKDTSSSVSPRGQRAGRPSHDSGQRSEGSRSPRPDPT